MSTLVEDSDRRCPHCSKLMMLDIGQDSAGLNGDGFVHMVHSCWSCGYVERDEDWKRTPVLELVPRSGLTGAQRLRALRDGVLVPLQYDTEPFLVSELDEEVRADA